jgi:hypothetical protein
MRPHIEEHAGGRLAGDIPQQWLDAQALDHCSVCSKLISHKFGGACPRCHPSLQTQTVLASGRPLVDGCPSIPHVCESKIPVKEHIPTGARLLWGQCMLTALAAVVQHNDTRAWTELVALPKMLLRRHGRGGKGNRRRVEAETKKL